MSEIKPKNKTTIIYDVTFTPPLATKIFNLIAKSDLSISGGKVPICYKYAQTTTTKVNSAYLTKMRRAIRKGLKANGVTQTHSIKHIKKII